MKINEIKITESMRQVDDSHVENLKASIQTCGLLQPLVVNKQNELVAGRNRFEALIQLGYEDVPVMKVGDKPEQLTEQEYFRLCQYEENLCRQELEPILRAKAIQYKKICLEKILGNANLAIEQIQNETNLSRSSIYTDLKIAKNIDNKLVNSVKDLNRKTLENIADEIEESNADSIKEKKKIIKEEIKEQQKSSVPSYYAMLKQISLRLVIEMNRLEKELDHTAPKKIQKLWQDEIPAIVLQIQELETKIGKILEKEGKNEKEN